MSKVKEVQCVPCQGFGVVASKGVESACTKCDGLGHIKAGEFHETENHGTIDNGYVLWLTPYSREEKGAKDAWWISDEEGYELESFGTEAEAREYAKTHKVEDENMGMRAAKMSEKGGDWTSKKISKLVKEGKPQKQAVAIALSMARRKGYKGAEKVKGAKTRLGTHEGKTIEVLAEGPLEQLIDRYPEAAERLFNKLDQWTDDAVADEMGVNYVAAWVGENPTFPTLLPAAETTYRDPNARVEAAAPYTAPAENAGTSYKNSDKFLPREDLYMGKAKGGRPVNPNDLTKPGAKKMAVDGPKRVSAGQDATVSFQMFENTKGAGDDSVQVTVKPAEMAAKLDTILQQAGFAQVQPGTYDRPGTDIKEAMQAFQGALAVGGFDIAETGQNVIIVTEKELVTAGKRMKSEPKDVMPEVWKKSGVEYGEELPHSVWPGLYPAFYMDQDGQPICADCVNNDYWSDKKIIDMDVNEEDPGLTCANCGETIPSSYGDDEIEVTEEEVAKHGVKGSLNVHAYELKLWKTPQDYAGDDYHDYYTTLGRSRDSDTYERANFDALLRDLGGEGSSEEWEKAHPEEVEAGNQEVMVARAGHWAVGWVEVILVHKDSDIVPKLQEIMDDFEDYPVIDEELVSEYEMEQMNSDWESFAEHDAMSSLEDLEGFEGKEFKDLEQGLQEAIKTAYEDVWLGGAGDYSGDSMDKAIKDAAEAWIAEGGTREMKGKEAEGQQELPGIERVEAFKKMIPLKAARLWKKLHAAGEEGAAPAEAAPAADAPKEKANESQRDLQVLIPAADKAKVQQIVEYLAKEDHSANMDETKDPIVLTTTFFPEEGALRDPEEDAFMAFIQSLGLKTQYVKGSRIVASEPEECVECSSIDHLFPQQAEVNGKPTWGWMCEECGHFHEDPSAIKGSKVKPVMGISTDAITYASLFHAAVMTTEPLGDEKAASLFISTEAGVSPLLAFKQGENGLHAEFDGKTMPILKNTTPQSLVAWVKEPK